MSLGRPVGGQMNPYTREQLLKVYNGEERTLPFLYHLANHRALLPILEMLQRKGLTGITLASFIEGKCGNEPIKFLAFCLKELQRTNVAKAPVVGPDGILQ